MLHSTTNSSEKYCWTWRGYLFGVVGWLCCVGFFVHGALKLYLHQVSANAALQGDVPMSLLLLEITWSLSQVLCVFLMMPVTIQWTFGFLYTGGIHFSRPKCTPTAVNDALQDALLEAGDENYEASAGVLMCVRVCTRGDNPNLIREICRQNIALLNDLGYPSLIEVVTDKCLGLPDAAELCRPNPRKLHGCAGVVQVLVPDSYKTPKGALYKARALNYALQPGTSCIEDDDVIVHLDEETLLHSTSIHGIAAYIKSASRSGKDDRIGQGSIFYGQGDVLSTVLTCCDSQRVADDYCRFRTMLANGSGRIGIHGSFVVCRAWLEKDVTFDFGPGGSVTEDAYFAVAAMEKGYSFYFINGYMSEKSPFTLIDYLKQRRRWLQGVRILARATEFPFWTRAVLRFTSDLWFYGPASGLSVFITLAAVHWKAKMYLPPVFVFMQAYATGTSFWLYCFGAFNNWTKDNGLLWYAARVALNIVLWPCLTSMEGMCVMYTWMTPEKKTAPTFHIVVKEYAGMNKMENADDRMFLSKLKLTSDATSTSDTSDTEAASSTSASDSSITTTPTGNLPLETA